MKWASSSNFYLPSNGYAYNVNNEILLGEKDIAHQESSLRNVLSDGLSDKCAGSIAHGQML